METRVEAMQVLKVSCNIQKLHESFIELPEKLFGNLMDFMDYMVPASQLTCI